MRFHSWQRFVSLCAAATLAALGLLASAATAGSRNTALRPDAFAGDAGSTQFLYVYNTGIAGQYTGQYARYSLTNFAVRETVAADGFGSNVAFLNGVPYFADTSSAGGFGVYRIPNAQGAVSPIGVFSGLCLYPTAFNDYVFATGPNGAFYVLQQCSETVSEYIGRKLVASFSGGGFGPGLSSPTALIVDHQGNLYVGDSSGGITFFAAGTTTPVVALAGSCCNSVYQLVVDKKGDVWSTRTAAPITYFDAGTCKIDQQNGTVKRIEVADHFHDGILVKRLYSAPAGTIDYGSDATSIAVDSTQRVYLTAADGAYTVVTDFKPDQACPTPGLTLRFPPAGYNSYAELAVDAADRLIVLSNPQNTIFVYPAGSTKPSLTVPQPSPLFNPSTIAIGGL
jgi:hypothetical protein